MATIVECEHVAAAVMTRWNRSSARLLVRGGLWYGRVSENAEAPYVRLKVSMAKHSRTSRHYLREFTVNLSVWGDNGPNGDVSRVLELLNVIMLRENLSIPEATRVVDVRSQTATLDVEPSTRNANDVMLASNEWVVKVQGA